MSLFDAIQEAKRLEEGWGGRVPISIIRDESNIPEEDVKPFHRWLNSTDNTSGFSSLERFLHFCNLDELYEKDYHRYLRRQERAKNPRVDIGKGTLTYNLGTYDVEKADKIIEDIISRNIKFNVEMKHDPGIGILPPTDYKDITVIGNKKDIFDLLADCPYLWYDEEYLAKHNDYFYDDEDYER